MQAASLRRILRNAAIVTASPLLFLALLEGGLRLGGYGAPGEFWVPVPGADAVQTNRFFGRRFFPAAVARTPDPIRLSDPKPDGVYRIFMVGGSAAMGFPEPAFSFARLLEVLLEARYPETDFEVVNTAMTAINSHVALPIVRDSAAYEPDAFVVYLGNNEVVGPYGPGSVFGQDAPPGALLRWAVRLRGTRTGQLFSQALARGPAPDDQPNTWRGMEMFIERRVAAGDPRLDAVYRAFAENLGAMRRTADGVGARILFSTVAVNLRDCPPFASADGPDGAEAKFRAGAFATARDLDMLRFRADSRINRAIEQAGGELVDAAAAFASASPDGFPGDEWLLEHVHLRFRGAWKLAETAAEAIAAGLPPEIAGAEASSGWLTAEQTAEAVAFTPWDSLRIERQIHELRLRPPFTFQLDHAERTERSARELAELAGSVDPAATTPLYEQALAARPDDASLRRRYAELLGATGQYERAVEQWNRLLELLPDRPAWLLARAAALRGVGRLEESVADYENALVQDPLDAQAQFGLGVTLQQMGHPADAEARYREAFRLDSGYAEAHNNLGLIRLEEKNAEAALAEFDEAIRIEPRFAPAHNNRGLALVELQRPEEALAAFAAAIERDPAYAEAQFHSGALLASLGRFDEAAPYFEQALQLDPSHAEAAAGLGAVRASQRDWDRALAAYEKAVALGPDAAEPHFGLGRVRNARGETALAIESFRRAIEVRPDYVEAMNDLGIVLARVGRLDESKQAFESALELRPDFAPARQNLERLEFVLSQTP